MPRIVTPLLPFCKYYIYLIILNLSVLCGIIATFSLRQYTSSPPFPQVGNFWIFFRLFCKKAHHILEFFAARCVYVCRERSCHGSRRNERTDFHSPHRGKGGGFDYPHAIPCGGPVATFAPRLPQGLQQVLLPSDRKAPRHPNTRWSATSGARQKTGCRHAASPTIGLPQRRIIS